MIKAITNTENSINQNFLNKYMDRYKLTKNLINRPIIIVDIFNFNLF